MARRFMGVLVAGMMILFVSCSALGSYLPRYDPGVDDATMAGLFSTAVDAIAARNKPALKSLFSALAMRQAKDFDAQVDALFGFFQGRVTSQGMVGGVWVGEDYNGPALTIDTYGLYRVDTVKGHFSLFMAYRTTDTAHTDGVGIYTLQVVRAADEAKYFGTTDGMEIPGIWCEPGK